MNSQEKTWVRVAEMYGIKLTHPINPHRIKTFRRCSARCRSELRQWIRWALKEAQAQHDRGIVSESGERYVKQILNEDRIKARENHEPIPKYEWTPIQHREAVRKLKK